MPATQTNKHRTGLIFFPAFDWAMSPTHPEREERLLYTRDQVMEEGLLDLAEIGEYKPLICGNEAISRTHFCVPDISSLATESHRISAGGCIRAADLVLTGETKNAFALVRPPGHHALKVTHGNRGFCNINIEAIMNEHIRQQYGKNLKIAVIDTDCHHGDGTQDIFWNDPNVLYISIHQDGRTLYPGTGFPDELGGPGGYCANFCLPLLPDSTDWSLLYCIEHFVLPVLADFKPDIIINSAGQDNHFSDPITNMQVTARGYARLTELLQPDIVVLEGGYSIHGALPYVNVGIILALAGLDTSQVREPDLNINFIQETEEYKLYTRNLVQDQLEVWQNRHETRANLDAIFGAEPEYERTRYIYYDTNGLTENRRETFMRCNHCPGLWTIDSLGDLNLLHNHIYAIHIPRLTCDDCHRKGLDLFKTVKKGRLNQIMLQDNRRDVFQTR